MRRPGTPHRGPSPHAMDDDEPTLPFCGSAVRDCCGVDQLALVGPPLKQCITCAYQDNGCDATMLIAHAEAMLAAGHTLLDDESRPLATNEAALVAVRAYQMTCPPYMDCTGGREWDCSRWLTALLSSPSGCAAAGVEPPARVLELGAGTGDLAVGLASRPGFAASLRKYNATDVEGRVGAIQSLIAARGLGSVLHASTLVWGAAVEATYDLVLVCETLHWKGDYAEAEDTLAPLATTIASACLGRKSTALLAHRERSAEREAAFYAMCRARGLAVAPCSAEAFAFAPPEDEQQDPGYRGQLCLVRMHDAERR